MEAEVGVLRASDVGEETEEARYGLRGCPPRGYR